MSTGTEHATERQTEARKKRLWCSDDMKWQQSDTNTHNDFVPNSWKLLYYAGNTPCRA